MEKDRSLVKYRGEKCQNCGHPLDKSDRFCSNCSQLNSNKQLSFRDFFNEFFSGLFAYDSRLNNTLYTILFRPGKIAKDYIEGKRIRYVNPFRFFLSISIIFFIIVSLFNDWDIGSPAESLSGKKLSAEQKAEIQKELEQMPEGDSQERLRNLIETNFDTVQNTYLENYETEEKLSSYGWYNELKKRSSLYLDFNEDTDIAIASIALDSLKHPATNYNTYLYQKAVSLNGVKKNPGIFVNYFLQKMPLFIFFFLPVLALFIWLLYIRRSFTYMEHLVFTFYVQSVYFILIGVAILLESIFEQVSFVTIFNFVFLFYLYKSLRKFYNQGRVKTILKFILINAIFSILAGVGFIISILFAVVLY